MATPIGNLGDLSPRGLEVLATADVVYCEDTRHSRQLFSANGLAAGRRLVALHEHNEASLCDEVVRRVGAGETVALVTDAGTPGVSDPGARVVAAVADAGLVVTTTPGPSAVVAALSVAGLPMERFCMEGFIPRKRGDRTTLFDSWRREERTVVFYESPQRLAGTLDELAHVLPDRRAVVARELTKLHEEVVRGTVSSLATLFAERDVRGELVVVLDGAPPAPPSDDDAVRRALRDEFARGASTRDASTTVASTLGAAHRRVYEMALGLKRDDEE